MQVDQHVASNTL